MGETLKHIKNRTLAKIAHYSPLYYYRRTNRKETFMVDNEPYSYFFDNRTWRSERCVELGFALAKLAEYGGNDVLEVGNVSHFYANANMHDIIDKGDSRNGSIDIDLFDYNPKKKYGLIFSISTLEHVGWDEMPRQRNRFLPAVAKLKTLLKGNGTLVFTVPIGYNNDLDKLIAENKLSFKRYFLKRISSRNEWVQISQAEAAKIKYGKPYPFANGIMIGIVKKSVK